MKSLKVMLMSASAVGLIIAGSAAYAGNDNLTSVTETGSNNSAAITQSGDHNRAGTPTWAPGSYAIWQNGNSNDLTIKQTSKSGGAAGNSIGLNNQYDINGVKQFGNNNQLTITQTATGPGGYTTNTVGAVKQTSSNGAIALTNKLTITQTANSPTGDGYHNVGQVSQTNTGSGNSNPADANSISITQTGGGFNLGNSVGVRTGYGQHQQVMQNGMTDAITISQNGVRNNIGTVKQDGGNGNTATLTQDNSAAFAALGHEPVDNCNPCIGHTEAGMFHNEITEVDQIGSTNTATARQIGNGNVISLLSQTGNSNTASLRFTGDNNGTTSFSGAAGTVALGGLTQAQSIQTGSGNQLSYTATGDNNSFGFVQNGNTNTINGTSAGDANQVAIAMVGSLNTVNFSQSGGSNNLGVSIYGDSNNAALSFTAGGNAQSVGLTPGNIRQSGPGNSIQMTVGDAAPSSNNLFAFTQTGSGGNSITGSINGGGYNQVAVLQNGGANVASFTQTGSYNNMAIKQ